MDDLAESTRVSSPAVESERVVVLKDIAQVAAHMGDIDRARQAAESALRLVNDAVKSARAISAQGMVEYYARNFEETRHLLARARPIFEREGWVAEVADTHLMTGKCWVREERLDRAIPELREAIRLAAELDDHYTLWDGMSEAGAVLAAEGLPERATRLLAAAEEAGRGRDFRHGMTRTSSAWRRSSRRSSASIDLRPSGRPEVPSPRPRPSPRPSRRDRLRALRRVASPAPPIPAHLLRARLHRSPLERT